MMGPIPGSGALILNPCPIHHLNKSPRCRLRLNQVRYEPSWQTAIRFSLVWRRTGT